MKNYLKVKNELENLKLRSAWNKGVNEYALELVEFLEDENLEITEKNMLNGASNWLNYSYGGCSLIYDEDICERLCNNTEKKRTKNGELMPNKYETWLDVQAKALRQACYRILKLCK